MKYNYEYNENDYKTPKVLYQMALDYWGIEKFDLDVCTTDFNIPAYGCYTLQGLCFDGDAYNIVNTLDGLTGSWSKYNWCNCPFNECAKWVKKAYEEQQKGNKTAMLIPVRTETKYFQDYIINNPRIDLNKQVIWLRKGYKFLNKDNEEMRVFKNALCIVFFE